MIEKAPPSRGAFFVRAQLAVHEPTRTLGAAARARRVPRPSSSAVAHPSRATAPKSPAAEAGHVQRRRGVEQHGGTRRRRRASLEHREHRRRVLRRRAPRRAPPRDPPRNPNRCGSIVHSRALPSRISITCVGPSGEISSIPGSPCTTSACTVPSVCSAPAISGTRRASATPTTCRPALAGLASGPTMFITVGMPSSRRTGPTCRIAGCISGANMKTMPASRSARSITVERDVDRDAERLEHVGAAALRGEGAVAVLRDPHAGARREQRGRRRDVERVDRAAAGAAGVDEIVRTVGRQVNHRAAERVRRAGDFVRRLALHAQADEQRRDLRRRSPRPDITASNASRASLGGERRSRSRAGEWRAGAAATGLADTQRLEHALRQPRLRRDERRSRARAAARARRPRRRRCRASRGSSRFTTPTSAP